MLKENSFEENFEEKQRRIFFLPLFKIRFNCVLTFTLANTSKSQYGVKFSPTNGGQKRIVEEGGGEKKQLRIDYLVVIRSIRNGTKNFNRRFSRSSPHSFHPQPLFLFPPSLFSPLSSLSFLFFSIPNAFHSAGRNSDRVKYFASSNGRTISTFSELIIGARVSRGGRRGGGGGCQLLQIHRDLLAKSTRDVCMKIHVNIQLCTLTICKFPGN